MKQTEVGEMEAEGVKTRHETGFLNAEDGTRLFWQGVRPESGQRGVVALLHGYNSRSDFLVPMMSKFAEAGLACYALDYRGHGQSEGLPCHVFRFREYLMDVRALGRHASEMAEGERVFLFGNSLGGLIASHYALRHSEQISGTVLTAPFFGAAFRVPGPLELCGRMLSCVCPTFKVPRRHPDLPENVTLRWWTETVAAQQVLFRHAEKFTLPVFILHGQRDGVASPSIARSIFERLGSRDKTLRILPGARHEDLDPCRGNMWWDEVREWMTCRTGGLLTS